MPAASTASLDARSNRQGRLAPVASLSLVNGDRAAAGRGGVAASAAPAANEALTADIEHRSLCRQLMSANAGKGATPAARAGAGASLGRWLAQAGRLGCDLPEHPEDLGDWMKQGVERTGERYQAYLARRKAGAPREYFGNRAHALYFLRTVAPTKLVDGAWLYGLLAQFRNPRYSDLVHTYVEELGNGQPDKNHVLLFRQLLDAHGIDDWQEQQDAHFEQGAIQLALATCTEEFLPEVIGFNLGYEQLPLHLLITAYELNELGIDPYYFTLHVTVDNAASGHASRAVKAATQAIPALGDARAFWQRVRNGYAMNDLGVGTVSAIESFDLDAEFHRVLARRSPEGKVAHSDYCRLEGRTVNQWLAEPDGIAGFVEALERKGWLQRGKDPAESRFWQLLTGEHGEMFGVFGEYELQVIQDWIRGDAATDGAAVQPEAPLALPRRSRSFRQTRLIEEREGGLAVAHAAGAEASLDPDVAVLEDQLRDGDPEASLEMVLKLMGPAHHWSVAGLVATRFFCRSVLHA
ncbi:MAG: iron-containing redox enzyme family protein [Comamonadaceae bacterium]|nr:MAG: iron-containing redox enzyme family protein [Comamonadaceae bacterium]